MEENKGVEEAVVKIRELTEDEKMERIAFLREKAIMDEKAIRAAGIDEGKEQIIMSMIKNNIEDDKIKKIANIDETELRRIKDLVKVKK